MASPDRWASAVAVSVLCLMTVRFKRSVGKRTMHTYSVGVLGGTGLYLQIEISSSSVGQLFSGMSP